MKNTLFMLFMCVLFLGLTGCNTMQGIGNDIGQAGDFVSESAQNVKDNLP